MTLLGQPGGAAVTVGEGADRMIPGQPLAEDLVDVVEQRRGLDGMPVDGDPWASIR